MISILELHHLHEIQVTKSPRDSDLGIVETIARLQMSGTRLRQQKVSLTIASRQPVCTKIRKHFPMHSQCLDVQAIVAVFPITGRPTYTPTLRCHPRRPLDPKLATRVVLLEDVYQLEIGVMEPPQICALGQSNHDLHSVGTMAFAMLNIWSPRPSR